MTRIALSTVLAAALGVVGLAAPAPALAEETCQGQPATIVGAPGEEIMGTDGADVIVTNGAVSVQARDGDDLVCTTNTAYDAEVAAFDMYVLAGAGDDVIDRSGDSDPAARATVHLNGGDDVLIGAPGRDIVFADAPGDESVRTGSGDDDVYMRNAVAPHLELDAGAGEDRLQVRAATTGLWVLDMGTAAAPTAARTLTGAGFEDIGFSADHPARTHVRFTGTDSDESFTVAPSRMIRGAAMGAGDDRLQLAGIYYVNANAHAVEPLDGGAGTDWIEVQAFNQRLRIDLAQDRFDYRFDNVGTPENSIPGFENVSLYAGPTRVLGDAGPNLIEWNGCPGVARGRGGNDVIDWQTSGAGNPCRHGGTTAMFGNTGDDQLIGGNRQDDRLVGGPGTDSARGGGGSDTCEAETVTSCERVL